VGAGVGVGVGVGVAVAVAVVVVDVTAAEDVTVLDDPQPAAPAASRTRSQAEPREPVTAARLHVAAAAGDYRVGKRYKRARKLMSRGCPRPCEPQASNLSGPLAALALDPLEC
jgi:hypothetical protein